MYYLLVSSALCSPWSPEKRYPQYMQVLFRYVRSSPFRQSFCQVCRYPHTSSSVYSSPLRRACGASCIRLRQKTVGACLYMPQDGHWLASFEVIPPPKLVFPRPKKQNSPALKTGCSRPLLEKNAQTHFFSSSFLAVFVGNSSLLKKVEKFRPKLRLSCFSGESFGTILSRRYRLSRT